MESNPWNVLSLEAFHFYCCPECEDKYPTKEQFVEHATSTHPKARETIMTILDSNVAISSVQPISDQFEQEKDRTNFENSVQPISVLEQDRIKVECSDDMDPFSEECQQERRNFESDFDEVNMDDSISIKTENIENIEPYFREVDIENITKNVKIEPMTTDIAEDCDKFEATTVTDIKHANKSHIQEEKKMHACDHCSKKYWLKRDLKRHVQDFHKKMFMCDHCSESYRLKRHLKLHVQTFHKYKCDHCSARYRLKGDFDQHMRMMHPPTHQVSYECDQCDKSYSGIHGSHTLRKHKSQKHPFYMKTYSCHLCQKTCKSQIVLDFHVTTHYLDERISKPFKCKLCDKNFTCKPYLKIHLRKMHDKKD